MKGAGEDLFLMCAPPAKSLRIARFANSLP